MTYKLHNYVTIVYIAGILDGLSILASQMIFVMTGVWAYNVSEPVEFQDDY